MGKTPNFAQQIIEGAVDRDIAAQEAAIRIKGDTKNTLIGQLRETGLSLEQAKSAAKQVQLQYYQTQNEAARLRHAGTALENKYNNIGIGLQQAWNEEDERGKQAARDKVVKSVQSGFEHERAATAGGTVLTPVKDQLGAAKKIQDLKKGEQDLAQGPKGPAASPEKREAAGALAESQTLKGIGAKYGASETIPTYEARTVFGRKWEDFADWVGGAGAGIDEETAVARGDFARIKSGLGSAHSKVSGQGAMTGDEQKTYDKAIAPGATWGDVQRGIVMLEDAAKARGMAAEAVGEAGGNVVTK